ncbi:MAG: PAS domain S-box protein [Pyrinomonadaceae bacterium]
MLELHGENIILVVNDTPDQLELMRIVLCKAGYRVETAADGREGLKSAQRERPDLIISDVMMPVMCGIELCRAVRRDDELTRTPILLVSALRYDTSSVVEGLRSGADDYLETPYDAMHLIAKVARLIERARMEAHYREIVEGASDIIYTCDAENRLISINKAGANLFGREQSSLIGVRVSELFEANGYKQSNGELKSGEPVRSIYHARNARGELRYFEAVTTPMHDAQNHATGTRSAARDITDRKQAEEQRAQLQAYAVQTALEWRLTFNAIKFPVLIVDFAGKVRRLNLAARELAGIGFKEIMGRAVETIGICQPWQESAELVKLIRKSRQTQNCQVRDEADGKSWDITGNLVPGFGDDEESVILIARDITWRVELETSMRQSEMMSVMGSLVAGVAHEVRNPLFGMSSVLDAFEVRFGNRVEYQRYTGILRDQLNRLNELMEELLEYGKPYKEEFFRGAIEDVLAHSIRSCKSLAERSNVNIVSSIDGDLTPVMMERRRLPKVFMNVIENAIRHSPAEAEVAVCVKKICKENLMWIDCTVQDSGPGFKAEDLPRIFEPFFTRRRGGTGLGLSIVQRIVEEHKGMIAVGNRPEGGAFVTVSLPAAAAVVATKGEVLGGEKQDSAC